MHNRYFLWQFAGRGPSKESHLRMGANSREDGVDLTQFGLPLAFILGIIGMLYHTSKDQKMAFFCTITFYNDWLCYYYIFKPR